MRDEHKRSNPGVSVSPTVCYHRSGLRLLECCGGRIAPRLMPGANGR